ncbi:hypothetical protein [uncultured Jannaschia sp.]|uniref:hypothetical protein n=1 Tax=uncultured Jannaschia sp. TaxID=293347 RepID=UPI0026391005|nr:hypothetical protein [uncultured Jannaschia sp.]
MSDRKASVVMGVASNTVIGSTFVASVTGAIGTLGTASTGTAIAGLAGAAKTSAVLYWIGGLVGGGVAAGGIVLGAGALGAGVYGSIKVRRAILGHARRKDGLSEREQAILQAVDALVMALRDTLDKEQAVEGRELALFSRLGITPLLNQIDLAFSEERFDDLKVYNRARLRGHVINLRKLQRRLEVA